jgi:hypothetical protein
LARKVGDIRRHCRGRVIAAGEIADRLSIQLGESRKFEGLYSASTTLDVCKGGSLNIKICRHFFLGQAEVISRIA